MAVEPSPLLRSATAARKKQDRSPIPFATRRTTPEVEKRRQFFCFDGRCRALRRRKGHPLLTVLCRSSTTHTIRRHLGCSYSRFTERGGRNMSVIGESICYRLLVTSDEPGEHHHLAGFSLNGEEGPPPSQNTETTAIATLLFERNRGHDRAAGASTIHPELLPMTPRKLLMFPTPILGDHPTLRLCKER
nr:hypothetical protein Iba_chr06aCG14490 [Ipomoea batatas]